VFTTAAQVDINEAVIAQLSKTQEEAKASSGCCTAEEPSSEDHAQ
jgi:hypothetical protein